MKQTEPRVRAPILGGHTLRVLAGAFGIPLEFLARRPSGARVTSVAQVRAYVGGRDDVSQETAERIWAMLVSWTIGHDDHADRPVSDVAQKLGVLVYARASIAERWAGSFTPITAGLNRLPEVWLPWLWIGLIEGAVLSSCWSGAEEDGPPLAHPYLARLGFAAWLREQCRLLELDCTPASLAARQHRTGTRALEARRKRFSRYLGGAAMPRTVFERSDLAQHLAGTRKWDRRARAIAGSVQRALIVAHLMRFAESRAPGYPSRLFDQFLELEELLKRHVGALSQDVRGAIFRLGGLGSEGSQALKAVASKLGDVVFRRMVERYAEGATEFQAHVLGGYGWLWDAAQRFGSGSEAGRARYVALVNHDPLVVLSAAQGSCRQ